MKNKNILLTVCALTLLVTSTVFGQRNEQRDSVAVWVRTIEGNEYQGYLEIQNSQELIIRTPNLGVIKIPMAQVRKIREIDPKDINRKSASTSSAYFSRYYLSSSAITMRKNEGYYHNSLLLFNRAEYGITDWWSIGAETSFYATGLFGGGITNRLQVPLRSDLFHLGVKGTIGIMFENGNAMGQLMGLATIGPADRNVTLGLGYSFEQGESVVRPTIQVSGDFRIGRKGAILFDLLFLETGSESLDYYIFGGRHLFRRVGLDYGIGLINENELASGFIIPIPWLGLTVPF
jgi:hypothetical protein